MVEVVHGFAVFAVVVVRAALYAVHLGGVGLFRPGGEVVLGHYFRLVVVAAQQVDFGYIIRYQPFVRLVALQGEKAAQRLVVPSLGVADVGEVVCAVVLIARAGAAQGLQPDGGLRQVAGMQVAQGEAESHVVAFGGREQLQAGLPEGIQRLLIAAFDIQGGGHQGIDAVGMRSVGVFGEESLQLLQTLVVPKFVGGAGQHVGGLLPLAGQGERCVFVCRLPQVGPQGGDGGGIGFLPEQGSAFVVEPFGRSVLFGCLCPGVQGYAAQGGAKQGEYSVSHVSLRLGMRFVKRMYKVKACPATG